MKKISYILFALFYLTLTTHVSASIHFCGGSITSISFFEHSDEDACECGKMTDNSCCNDLEFQFETNDNNDNLSKQISFNFTQKFSLLFVSVYKNIFILNNTYKTSSFYIFDHNPPYNLLHLSAIFLRI